MFAQSSTFPALVKFDHILLRQLPGGVVGIRRDFGLRVRNHIHLPGQFIGRVVSVLDPAGLDPAKADDFAGDVAVGVVAVRGYVAGAVRLGRGPPIDTELSKIHCLP